MKIRPVFELFHTDKRTDMITLTVAFRCFVNAPEKLRKNTLYVVFVYMFMNTCMFQLLHEC